MEVISDFFPIVHHIHLVHENLKSMQSLITMLHNYLFTFFPAEFISVCFIKHTIDRGGQILKLLVGV